MQLRKRTFIFCMVMALIVGSVCGYAGNTVKGLVSGSSLEKDSKIRELQHCIDKYYLNDYDQTELNDSAYKGYIEGLGDKYSQYMNKDEFDSWQATNIGEYSGVGITFAEDEKGNFVVLAITENAPASKTDIEPGDILLKVDGEEFTNSDLMSGAIRGDEGTDVTIEYTKDGKETKEVTITREKILLESVTHKMLNDDTGYIHLTQFVTNTSEDFESAMLDITSKGAKKLVLDLRDNGGGLVNESVDVADQFLDEGVVAYVEDKDGNTEELKAKNGKTDMETVVLVNGNSASASEILSGALKDNGFEIIGEKTFGKGIIQTTLKLHDGSALTLTALQYLSPDRHKIHGKGIKPTIQIKDNEKTEADEQLDKALEVLN